MQKAKADAKPWAEERGDRYVSEQVEKDVAVGIDREASQAKWRSAVKGGVLPEDFVLTLTDGRKITVAEVLAEPDRWDEKTCHDPMQPYLFNDPRIAQIYAHNRKLHSFLYDATYRLGSRATTQELYERALRGFSGIDEAAEEEGQTTSPTETDPIEEQEPIDFDLELPEEDIDFEQE